MIAGLQRHIRIILSDDRAATMVEYALMIALIATISFTVILLIGQETSTVFSDAADGFNHTN